MLAWEQFFDTWDALLCPPAMVGAFPHCEPGSPIQVDGQTVDYWFVSAHCTLFNYTGHPAAVLPYARDRSGLPIGVQLVAKRWCDAQLLGIAQAVAKISGDFKRPEGY
jgi:amidase